MLKIKRLRDCTITEAVEAWNKGFEGYYFNMTTTVDKFISRLSSESLSADLSVVAFWDEKPVGLILNGTRKFQGETIAWNGGTAVATEFRSKGIGRRMLEVTLDILEDHEVYVSTLEAISENKGAIDLYQSLGYEIIDHLECLEKKGTVLQPESNSYRFKKILPVEVGYLPFYQGKNPWQTHWQSVMDGEAIIAEDVNGEAIGYALFKRIITEDGNHAGTTLYQCEADRCRSDQREIIQYLLAEAFQNTTEQTRLYVPNLPILNSSITKDILNEHGFEPIVKLVYMKQILK